ncbi:peptide deformylase [Miltoncostaea oceani]|uniref:peptide deformylase n=1 Tax=Miltoncostaea oceani TaxID=2843216 RepID=UPI001C3DED06|nr:peptide deformylase [Miltoncostaea oceani]
MVREVLRYPDRRLKLPAAPVGRPGAAVRRLADDLRDTAASFPRTVGIAAPQIGALWRVAYVDCTGHKKVPDAQGPMWLIDPVVVDHEGDEIGREGCLSLPDITANVRRATRVVVEATDLDGSRRAIAAEGFEARVMLHEIDHLDGVLILDRVASLALDVFPRRR